MPQVIIPVYNSDEHDFDHNFSLVEFNDQLIELIMRRHKTFWEAQSKDPDIHEIRYWDSSVKYFGYFNELNDGSLTDSKGNAIVDIDDRLVAYEIIVLQTPVVLPNSRIGQTDAEQMAIRKEGVWWSASTPRGTYVDTVLIPIELIIGLLKKADRK